MPIQSYQSFVYPQPFPASASFLTPTLIPTSNGRFHEQGYQGSRANHREYPNQWNNNSRSSGTYPIDNFAVVGQLSVEQMPKGMSSQTHSQRPFQRPSFRERISPRSSRVWENRYSSRTFQRRDRNVLHVPQRDARGHRVSARPKQPQYHIRRRADIPSSSNRRRPYVGPVARHGSNDLRSRLSRPRQSVSVRRNSHSNRARPTRPPTPVAAVPPPPAAAATDDPDNNWDLLTGSDIELIAE